MPGLSDSAGHVAAAEPGPAEPGLAGSGAAVPGVAGSGVAEHGPAEPGRARAGLAGAAPADWTDDGSADRRFRVVPAAYVLLHRAGTDGGPDEVLLQLRQGTGFMDGYWAAGAAGHVEANESVVGAAVREAREELGVTIDPVALRPLTVMHRGQPGGPALEQRFDVFFEAWHWSGEPRAEEATKSADLRWYPLDALPEPVVPHELRVLHAIAAGHVPRLMVHGF